MATAKCSPSGSEWRVSETEKGLKILFWSVSAKSRVQNGGLSKKKKTNDGQHSGNCPNRVSRNHKAGATRNGQMTLKIATTVKERETECERVKPTS